MKNEFLVRLAKLIDVKSIITILIILVFCYLSIIGKVNSETFMLIVTNIVTWYFSSQGKKVETSASLDTREFDNVK
jgi:hypothetical protein